MLGGIIGGIATAAASLIGGRQANKANAAIAEQNNAFNAEQAQIDREWSAGQAAMTRDFQERMRNTSYQAAMADMKKAGLNPMLAFSQGGAPMPTGATGSSSAASSSGNPTMRDTISPALASGMQAMNFNQALANMQADEEVKKATASNIRADTEIKLHQPANIRADTDNKIAQNFNIKEELRLIRERTQLAFQQGLTEPQRRNLMDAQTKLIAVQTKHEHGKIDYTEALKQLTQIQKTLSELGIPKAINEAEAESSEWKRDVAPYLVDLERATHSASNLGIKFPTWPKFGKKP